MAMDGHLWWVMDPDGATRAVSWEEHAAWYQRVGHDGKRVARDELNDVSVSTVFLTLDHNHWGGAPILFETMIFGGQWDQWQWRYHTRDEAAAAHLRIVEALRQGRDPSEAVES